MNRYILPAVMIVLASCTGVAHKDRIDSLDSMRIELETVRQDFSKLDTVAVSQRYDTIMRYLDLIKTNLYDTLTREQADFMSDYYQIRKPLGSFHRSYRMLMEELEYTESQLNDLARSLEQGSIASEKAEQFYDLEMSSAQTLHQTVSGKIIQINEMQAKYDTLHPLVLQYLEEAAVHASATPK